MLVPLQEKETEMAAISAQRTRFVDEQVDQLQEQERKSREEAANSKKQLKQLTKDFQYNLQLLNDRDTELELMENQITAHKETENKRIEACCGNHANCCLHANAASWQMTCQPQVHSRILEPNHRCLAGAVSSQRRP